MKINIDGYAAEITDSLGKAGYEAYVVGGCVRDSVMGRTPEDWDVTTSAKPEEVIAVFGEKNTVATGLRHGTVTVIKGGKPYEVTTFRRDGEYSDFRHPEKVEFVSDLAEDLKRRDFTVNALAYSEKTGLIDLYGGLADIESKTLRAVGDPEERFNEDALRILRAARFSSVLGFGIESGTSAAMSKLCDNLKKVSAERVFTEICKLVRGKNATAALMDCHDAIFAVIPELAPCYKFEQKSKWHRYDVYEHIARAVGCAEGGLEVKLAMLLHDVGKPECFFVKDGEGHFYGHGEKSYEKARKILRRLKASNALFYETTLLVRLHDRPIKNDERKIKRLLSEIRDETFLRLVAVKRADGLAQGTEIALEEVKGLKDIEKTYRLIKERGDCYTLSSLAVNGSDLAALGYRGEAIGKELSRLLSLVIDGAVENDRERLIKISSKRI